MGVPAKPVPDKEYLDLLFVYCPESGVLYWNPDRPDWTFKTKYSKTRYRNEYSGKRAGYVFRNRYGYPQRKVRVDGKTCSEHRLIWMIMTGEQPPDEVDHKDRNSLNNAWDNLRDGTNSLNQRNRSISRLNSSGVSGVYWENTVGKWRVRPTHDGKKVCLGFYDEIQDAKEVVREFYESHGFETGHGEQELDYQ